jgi:hypothetical protein
VRRKESPYSQIRRPRVAHVTLPVGISGSRTRQQNRAGPSTSVVTETPRPSPSTRSDPRSPSPRLTAAHQRISPRMASAVSAPAASAVAAARSKARERLFDPRPVVSFAVVSDGSFCVSWVQVFGGGRKDGMAGCRVGVARKVIDLILCRRPGFS